MRRQLEEFEQLVASLDNVTEQSAPPPWEDRQREYESLLEEKSEVIRRLASKNSGIAGIAGRAGRWRGAAWPRANADMDEVEKLKVQLEEERRRLRDDEEALMTQMREMEMAMSRDRADYRASVPSCSGSIATLCGEVEQAGRDTGLRDRLLALTRRPQDQARTKTMTDISLPEQAEPQKKQNSGLFRRLFGG